MFCFDSMLSLNSLLKKKNLLLKSTSDFNVPVCMGVSSVRRWVKHFKDGNTSIQDEPCSWHPRTASMERNKERVDELIREDRCVTVTDITAKLAVGHSAVHEMIQSLGYWKVCARWFPGLLTEDHKLQRFGWETLPHPPYSPNWYPLTTIFSVLLRNRCEANATRCSWIFGKQCVRVCRQLEWSIFKLG